MVYQHQQRGYWFSIIVAFAAAVVLFVQLVVRQPVVTFVACGVAAALAVLALCFNRLTVEDRGDHLHVQFGPIPLIRRQIAYRDIRDVKPARSTPLDGWGVHYMPGHGWIWNVWGRDCVEFTLPDRTLRIGTDDVEGLIALIRSKKTP